MKKIIAIGILIFLPIYGYTQTQKSDSLKDIIEGHEGRLNSLDERVLVNETDLGKLNKIKVSGYIQSQWEEYGSDLEKTNGYNNTFYVRRARVKITYEALDGVKFVLQPDFSTGNLTLKDAYAVVSIPKIRYWSLWAGQMNRPDYEVEYSSGQREVLERSRMIRTIYPGEREVGVKLEYNGFKVPLKFQFMVMNGNFSSAQAKDADSYKDIMARLIYTIRIPAAGIGIDFGPNFYHGANLSKYNKYFVNSNGTLDSLKTAWKYLDKNWAGGEIQIYADVLGGLAVKAEYITGKNSTPSTVPATATVAQMKSSPSAYNNFVGYYVYFIKNIGSKNQFVARYDYYDPNTKLSGDEAGGNVYYKTWTLAWQYYLNDNIRITLNYDLPVNEINVSHPVDSKDNTLGVRIQAKF